MLEAFGLSDPGCVRLNNEDYFISDCELGIFILADGMGGANAGEYASHLSAELLYEFLRKPPMPMEPEHTRAAFLEANWAVRQAANANPQLEGMGTTLLVARQLVDGRWKSELSEIAERTYPPRAPCYKSPKIKHGWRR